MSTSSKRILHNAMESLTFHGGQAHIRKKSCTFKRILDISRIVFHRNVQDSKIIVKDSPILILVLILTTCSFHSTLSAPNATIVDLLKILTCTNPWSNIQSHMTKRLQFFWHCTNKTYDKGISTNQCLILGLADSFHISYCYQKSNIFDPNTTM